MAGYEINALYNELSKVYSGGFSMSRAGLFNRAFNDGRITMEVLEAAREYYGRLWNYVGD